MYDNVSRTLLAALGLDVLDLIAPMPDPVPTVSVPIDPPVSHSAETADAPVRPKRDPGGDHALVTAFAKEVTGQMLYSPPQRLWYRWMPEAGAWRLSERGEAEQAFLAVATRRFNAACKAYRREPSSDANKREQNDTANYLKNANYLNRALGLAKSWPGLVCLPSDFNVDPYALPVANGVIDLRTGQLTPAAPELMVAKLSPVVFDPAAECPMFDRFLATIFPDGEVRAFIQRAAGYSATGLVDEEVAFVAFGSGANGKSVFANILAAVLGEFAHTLSPAVFTKGTDSATIERHVTSLVGKRLALANEIQQGAVWRDDKLKELASREAITGRYLRDEVFNFMPTHKLWFRTNHLPGAHDASPGFWRRIVAIPFQTAIPDSERIPDLDRQIIAQELPGVLNWLVQGARDYLSRGRLNIPASLMRITTRYRDNCDVFGRWLAEKVEVAEGGRLVRSDAYTSLRYYFNEEGVQAPARAEFVRNMETRGHLLAPQRCSRGEFFAGLRLQSMTGDSVDDFAESSN